MQSETADVVPGAATRVVLESCPFAPLCENMDASYTKPEVHNLLHCR